MNNPDWSRSDCDSSSFTSETESDLQHNLSETLRVIYVYVSTWLHGSVAHLIGFELLLDMLVVSSSLSYLPPLEWKINRKTQIGWRESNYLCFVHAYALMFEFVLPCTGWSLDGDTASIILSNSSSSSISVEQRENRWMIKIFLLHVHI